jgi:hypothetical protein
MTKLDKEALTCAKFYTFTLRVPFQLSLALENWLLVTGSPENVDDMVQFGEDGVVESYTTQHSSERDETRLQPGLVFDDSSSYTFLKKSR